MTKCLIVVDPRISEAAKIYHNISILYGKCMSAFIIDRAYTPFNPIYVCHVIKVKDSVHIIEI